MKTEMKPEYTKEENRN